MNECPLEGVWNEKTHTGVIPTSYPIIEKKWNIASLLVFHYEMGHIDVNYL